MSSTKPPIFLKLIIYPKHFTAITIDVIGVLQQANYGNMVKMYILFYVLPPINICAIFELLSPIHGTISFFDSFLVIKSA